MTEAKRRITITKRVSLADFGEGWDDCYAIVTPADYATYQQIAQANVENMTNAESIMFTMDTVRKHFVRGQIMVWDEQAKAFGLNDMTLKDIDNSLEISNRLYAAIMGLQLDPKGSNAEAPNGQQQTSSANNTGTTSSMGLPKVSPPPSSTASDSSVTGNGSASPTPKQ